MSTDTIVVCGASADIGLALLERLARSPDGARVIAHCHRGAARMASLAGRLAGRCLVVEADLADVGACEAFVARVDDSGWQPTHFVHLPALPLVYERFSKFDWPRFQKDLELQVGSLTRLLPHWLPAPRRQGKLRDVVVVSSSVTVNVPPKYMAMYTTVKYAQLGLLRSLTAEYAERGVVVNAVSPSMVQTRFLDKIPATAQELSAAASPLGRNASADEVAEVIQMLLSTRRPLWNGANIVLGGGSVF
ncbi:MAG TPA: SDR family oxidoreductase [Polyangiaceae bacterium]|nr:SDR family oxidoreductase [Polyangiaceae bacterium]